NAFVRYYTPAQARSMNVRTDQIVEMHFNNVDIDRYRDQRDTREISKQVVVKEIVIKADSVVKEYATVKAKITTTRRTLQSNGLLQVTVRIISLHHANEAPKKILEMDQDHCTCLYRCWPGRLFFPGKNNIPS